MTIDHQRVTEFEFCRSAIISMGGAQAERFKLVKTGAKSWTYYACAPGQTRSHVRLQFKGVFIELDRDMASLRLLDPDWHRVWRIDLASGHIRTDARTPFDAPDMQITATRTDVSPQIATYLSHVGSRGQAELVRSDETTWIYSNKIMQSRKLSLVSTTPEGGMSLRSTDGLTEMSIKVALGADQRNLSSGIRRQKTPAYALTVTINGNPSHFDVQPEDVDFRPTAKMVRSVLTKPGTGTPVRLLSRKYPQMQTTYEFDPASMEQLGYHETAEVDAWTLKICLVRDARKAGQSESLADAVPRAEDGRRTELLVDLKAGKIRNAHGKAGVVASIDRVETVEGADLAHYSSLSTPHQHAFTQTTSGNWIEIVKDGRLPEAEADPGPDYAEIGRAEGSIYLRSLRGTSLVRLNMAHRRAERRELGDETWSPVTSVHFQSISMGAGWQMNHVAFGVPGRPYRPGNRDPKLVGTLTQIGRTHWIERRHESDATHIFDEVSRCNSGVILRDPLRNLILAVPVRGTIKCTDDPENWGEARIEWPAPPEPVNEPDPDMPGDQWLNPRHDSDDYHTLTSERRPETWLTMCRVTTRSTISNEYVAPESPVAWGPKGPFPASEPVSGWPGMPPEGLPGGLFHTAAAMPPRDSLPPEVQPSPRLCKVPVFRTVVVLPPDVTHADFYASSEAEVVFGGKLYKIDPKRPVRLRPSAGGRIVISVRIEGLKCPRLYFRTNRMTNTQKHIIAPDVELQQKLRTAKDGHLYDRRGEVGLEHASKGQMDAIQTVLRSVAHAAKTCHNTADHGVHRDQALWPAAMPDPHFRVKLGSDGKNHSVKAMKVSEAKSQLQGIPVETPGAGAWFGEDIWTEIKSGSEVIVHTVTNVAGDIWDGGVRLADDAVATAEQIGDDLSRGDIAGALDDAVRGGETLGQDLYTTGSRIGGHLAEGGRQMLAIAVKIGDTIKRFVFDTLDAAWEQLVKPLIHFMADGLGWAAAKFAGLFVDDADFDEIAPLREHIRDNIHGSFDKMEEGITKTKDRIGRFAKEIKTAINTFESGILENIDGLGTTPPAPPDGHSTAVGWVEWLFDKWLDAKFGANPLAEAHSEITGWGGTSPFGEVRAFLGEELEVDGGSIRSKLDDAVSDLTEMFSDLSHAPQHLMRAIVRLLAGISELALDIVERGITGALDILYDGIEMIRNALDMRLDIPGFTIFYETLTNESFSLMNFITLMIAAPVNMIQKAVTGGPLMPRPLAAASAEDHTSLSAAEINAAIYAGAHIALSITGPIAGFVSVLADRRAADARRTSEKNAAEHRPSSGFKEFHSSSRSWGEITGMEWYMHSLQLLNFAVGCLAQSMGCPIPEFEQRTQRNLEADATRWKDVFDAPNEAAHAVWDLQMAFNFIEAVSLVVAVMGTKQSVDPLVLRRYRYFNRVAGGLTFAFAIGQVTLMSIMDQADRQKYAKLLELYDLDKKAWKVTNWPASGTALDKVAAIDKAAGQENLSKVLKARRTGRYESEVAATEWLFHQENYIAWGNQPGLQGITRKGFANVMDTFPNLAAICFVHPLSDTKYALLVGAGLSAFGHAGEGITTFVRVNRHELY